MDIGSILAMGRGSLFTTFRVFYVEVNRRIVESLNFLDYIREIIIFFNQQYDIIAHLTLPLTIFSHVNYFLNYYHEMGYC